MLGSGGPSYLPFRLFYFLLLVGLLGAGCEKMPRRLSLCEIQGTELESPYLEQEVITTGLVIADLDSLEPGGYFLLDETCPLDGEASRGLYISLGASSDLVDLGDVIQVQGIIRETAGETHLVAELTGLEILSLNNPLPDPVNLANHLIPPLAFGYERWEGQLVTIPRAVFVDNRGNQGWFRVAPHLPKDPLFQFICFMEESFSLGIREELVSIGEGSQKTGQELEDLIGLVRQGQGGYYLQLVRSPKLRAIGEEQLVDATYSVDPVSFSDHSLKESISPTITPTTTLEPSSTVTLIPIPTTVPSPTPYPIRLLISEVMPNPSGEEPGGEWIEIYNPAGGRLSLDGIKVGDEISPAGKEGLIRFPEGFFINEGQALVIANRAGVFSSRYGFLPDFELVDSDSRVPDLLPYAPWGGSTVKLSNSGDEVILVDPWDRVLDLVVYGKSGVGGFTPPIAAPQEGHSLERYPPEADRDQAGDWRERSNPSPGWLDRSPPTLIPSNTVWPTSSPTSSPGIPTQTPGLMISSPTLFSSPTEIPLHTSTPILSQTPSITLQSTWTETPPSRPSETPGMTILPTKSITPSPTPGTLLTSTPLIKTATMTPSLTLECTPSPSGTLTLSQTSTTAATFTAIPEPELVINEIHADPDPLRGDSNGDGLISTDDDEFLELVNIGGQVLDLSGWGVYDEIRLRFTFPEGVFLAPGCGLVLFGGGEPLGDFGGSQVFTAGSLGLNNSGDLVRLVDPDGVEIAAVRYGPEGNQDQSLTRHPDLIGLLPLVLHSQVPGAEERLYSPGTRIDGSVFGRCP